MAQKSKKAMTQLSVSGAKLRVDPTRISKQATLEQTEKAYVKPGIHQYKLPKNTFPPPRLAN